MDEFTELLKFLHGAGVSVIPWICLGIAIWLVVQLQPHVATYLKNQSAAKLDQAKHDGERNEIIRNCSATIEACTAVLEMIQSDRDELKVHLDKHEELSNERMCHIQDVVNQCRDELYNARIELTSINARLNK